MHIICHSSAKISPQSLSELRRLWTNVPRQVGRELFPDSGIVSPLRLRGSRVYACLGVTCHLHFWQNDRGLLRDTAVNTGVERTPNKSQHRKLPPLLPGIGTGNLSITSPALLPTILSRLPVSACISVFVEVNIPLTYLSYQPICLSYPAFFLDTFTQCEYSTDRLPFTSFAGPRLPFSA